MLEPAGRSSLRVAVTGASGFIGSHLVMALAARGDAPVRVLRPFDAGRLADTLRGVHVVVHLAGVVSTIRRADYFVANEIATSAVAHAAREAGAGFVHISSLAAAGPAPPSAPRVEDDEAHPITAYGESKLAGERVVRSIDGLHWIILRPGVVYGPADRALLPLVRYARLGVLPVVGHARSAYTFVYIDDAVRAILASVDALGAGRLSGETLFVGHRRPVGARELLEGIRAAVGSSAALVPVPRLLVRLAAMGGDLTGFLMRRPATINSRRFAELYSPGFVCLVDRLRDRLGVEAEVDLQTGLVQAVRWYEARGLLRGVRSGPGT